MKSFRKHLTEELKRYDDGKTGFGLWDSKHSHGIKLLKQFDAKPFALLGSNNPRYDMVLGKLGSYDRKEYRNMKRPAGTEIYRYTTPNSARAGSGEAPIVAVNMDKGHVYFMTPESRDTDEPAFETRVGFRATFIRTTEPA